GPARAIVLWRQVEELEARGEHREELVLDRADRDVSSVGGLVDLVPRSASVEDVGAARLAPLPAGEESAEHGREERRAVDHRGVDHLAAAGAPRFEQRAGNAEGEQHAAAAEVADEIERRYRRLALAAERMQ